MDDEVVYVKGEYVILYSKRLFSSGFNVYKADEPGGSTFTKANPRNQWFTTKEAAIKFIESINL